MDDGNAETSVDRKHTRKVEAERRRRGEINERIEIIRSLLRLNTQSSKALIERNRRRLEREELQKLEQCLFQHGKLSDVQLLEATISVLQAKSTIDAEHMSASTVRLCRQADAQHRAPLQELDPNRGALFSRDIIQRKPIVRADSHEKSDSQSKPAAHIRSRIWRPWEGEKNGTFFSLR